MSAHPIDQHLPFPNNRIAVVSITRHGIALAGRFIAALPGATLFAPQKFHTEAAAAAPGAFACYEGKVGDQVPALFAGFDGIIAIVSLGAVVRLIAPHLKKKETDPGVVVVDEAGREIGRGLARYDSEDAGRIRGLKSDAIEGVLGFSYGPMIHADDLALAARTPA